MIMSWLRCIKRASFPAKNVMTIFQAGFNTHPWIQIINFQFFRFWNSGNQQSVPLDGHRGPLYPQYRPNQGTCPLPELTEAD
jgi:hypothetical protein